MSNAKIYNIITIKRKKNIGKLLRAVFNICGLHNNIVPRSNDTENTIAPTILLFDKNILSLSYDNLTITANGIHNIKPIKYD